METKASFDQIVGRVEDLLHHAQDFQQLENSVDELQRLIGKGKLLIENSKSLAGWKILKKHGYAKKLLKLENDVCCLLKKELKVGDQEDARKVLEKLKEFLRAWLQSLAYFTSVPEDPSLTVGFDLPKEELKAMLLQDGTYVVGVCAPGGCGKTTLVANLCKDKDIKERFPKIVFLTVSSSPKLKVIFRTLWVRLLDETDIPIFTKNEDAAIAQLMERLRQKNLTSVLVVLDDVWSESILTKFNFKEANIKTIVTSRIKFQQLDSTYSMKVLRKDDARALFDHHAFPEGDVAQKPDEKIVEQIVERCQGFALALKVLGSSLRHQQPDLWSKTLDILKEGTQLFDDHKDIYDCLAPSIKSLDHGLYECYLDLGCFPEHTRIPASALMDIWVETYGLSEDAAYKALLKFSNRNLVILHERYATTEVDKSLQNLYIIQHTLLRDLTIYLSQHGIDTNQNQRLIMHERGETLPNTWCDLKDQVPRAKIVSVHTGKMDPNNWPDISFPECEALILHFSAESYCLPPFLSKMEKLKVLIIANYNSKHAELRCIPSQHLPTNIKRLRLEKTLVSVLPFHEVPLLHKFTLSSCKVAETEDSLNYFTIFPSLVELEIDYCIDLVELPKGISCLTKLQKLSVRNCPDLVELPDELGDLVNLIELKLQACVGLETLPSSLCKLQKLQLLDLSYCSMIEELPEDFGKLSSLEKLDMRSCSEILNLPDSVLLMQSLKSVICDAESAKLWDPLPDALSNVHVSVVKEILNLNWLW